MSFENIALFLWGLWLFMLWIIFFDEATKKMVSGWIKKIIKKATNNLFKTLWIGFLATIILQWSSAVLLILESFVSAWMLEFTHAARVIMWCNVWSSAIWVILWSLWLEFDLASYALPLMWILALCLLIIKSDKTKNILKILIWLCLVFVWLWYMNDWMAFVANSVDFVSLSSHSILLFYAVWLFATIIMQSSAITIALVLSAASVWLVDYRMWIMLLLWCFLWTTSTPALWCIRWWYLKKQVAATQVIFNAVLSVIWIATLPFWSFIMEKLFPDIVIWLSAFALIFKAVFVIIMLPFLNKYVWFIQKLFPKKDSHLWLAIKEVSPNVSEAWLNAVRDDLKKLIKRVFHHMINTRNMDKAVLDDNFDSVQIVQYDKVYWKDELRAQYDEIKEIEQLILVFLLNMKSNIKDKNDMKEADSYSLVLSHIIRSDKYMKDIHKTIEKLKDSDNEYLMNIYNEYRIILLQLFRSSIDLLRNGADEKKLKNFEFMMSRIKNVADEDSINSFVMNSGYSKYDSTVLSDLLYMNQHFYLSCFSLLSALSELYGVRMLPTEVE